MLFYKFLLIYYFIAIDPDPRSKERKVKNVNSYHENLENISVEIEVHEPITSSNNLKFPE